MPQETGMELLFAYAAGLLTLINPCVLPVLPIVLAGALQANPFGPVSLAAGMSLSFVVLGVTISAFGFALGLDTDTVARAGAILMIGFGLILLVPRFSAAFATATAGLSRHADTRLDDVDQGGLGGQFLGGLLLGAVWSPCVGPTLGGAISLASQGQNLGWATAIMAAFALGVSTVIIGLVLGARGALIRNRALMARIASAARPALGAVFVIVGLALVFQLHHAAEAWLLDALPAWLIDLSVSV